MAVEAAMTQWRRAVGGGADAAPADRMAERLLAFVIGDLPADQADRITRSFGYLACATAALGPAAAPADILAHARRLRVAEDGEPAT